MKYEGLDLVEACRPLASFLSREISQSVVFCLCFAALRMIERWIAMEISWFSGKLEGLAAEREERTSSTYLGVWVGGGSHIDLV